MSQESKVKLDKLRAEEMRLKGSTNKSAKGNNSGDSEKENKLEKVRREAAAMETKIKLEREQNAKQRNR